LANQGDGWIRGYLRWMAGLAIGFIPFMLRRFAAHLVAFGRFHTAGECRNCRANLTWPIRGGRPTYCTVCGIAEPCPVDEHPPDGIA
jgi:hypothetical protein